MIPPSNFLLICADQHSPYALGYAGNLVIQTPNLDGLAARGTSFERAYSPSPICVPARACLATGRYAHQINAWDNAAPYTGLEASSWGHRLTSQNRPPVTIGKLHYRRIEDPTGFPDQRIPMHVSNGQGNLFGLLRDEMPPLPQFRSQILAASAGESEYARYDSRVADLAVRWLHEEAPSRPGPWTLMVSFASPHPPFIALPEYLSRYPAQEIPLPINGQPEKWADHPALNWLRRQQCIQEPFPEPVIRQAIAVYYAMVTFVDAQAGRVLQALHDANLAASTRIVYTSDHGEMLGRHGLWFKCSMAEASARVPLILAGPDVPAGKACRTPVSLVDLFPTIIEAVGAANEPGDADRPGESLFDTATRADRDRLVFSEFHGALSSNAAFMVCDRRWKYIHYVGGSSQLFDLVNDPDEINDLAGRPAFRDTLADYEQSLREIVDPEQVDLKAKLHQRERLKAAGGKETVLGEGFKIPFSPAPGNGK